MKKLEEIFCLFFKKLLYLRNFYKKKVVELHN